MELSRKEVPLYGQVSVYLSVTHTEEVFVVLEGSTLRHVLQTKFDKLFYFITPGHNQQETVCVRAYTHVGGVLRCVGVAFLTFVEDDAQELAEYLVTHSNRINIAEYNNLIGRYSLSDSSRRAQMDRRVTLALTNTHTPHTLLGQPGQESLLHLCVRLGFVCVCEFLLCQPGSLMMINSTNQDGDTPLQLAQRTNQHDLINLLSHPPNPLTTPLGGVTQVCTGASGLLRFTHTFEMMSLSECVSSSQHLQSAILLLMECVTDCTLTHTIKEFCVRSRVRNTDEPPSKLSQHVVFPYSEWFSSSSDDDNNDDDDEDLLLSITSDGSEKQISSPDLFRSSSKAEDQEPQSEHSSEASPRNNTADLFPPKSETHTDNKSVKKKNAEMSSSVFRSDTPETEVELLSPEQQSSNELCSVNWKNPQQLKMLNNCPMLLCSSSHSSPALFGSNHNTETQRRRSNSEGHEVTWRKCWPVIGESTFTSALPPLDYTSESWSTLVDSDFLETLDRGVIRRQDVIYELMQTEFHHLQTLTVMADVLRRGLLEEVELEEDVIGQIFPRLDDLIMLHSNFLTALETRRRSSVTKDNHRNYIIQHIGDILIQQFCGSTGEQMMVLYGEFCSKHPDALRVYKQLQNNNRKLQLFIRQLSSNSVIKRREIPEFLLLITQRITKYPIILDRLLQHTAGGGAEQTEVAMALEGVRCVLVGVEECVCEVQRAQKLDDIISRLDPKSFTRLKSGETYSRHTLTHTSHTLTHSHTLTCRTTSGRLREVLALLLTDVLVFLQEKEQKFTFAALEQKPAVVQLKGLIWREIANQDRGLFLISSDASGPEMYEIHTNTREERHTWITLLEQNTHRLSVRADTELKTKEKQKLQKIHKLQETLFSLDLQVCVLLEEKLCVCDVQWSVNSPHLLHHTLHTHTHTHTPQGYTLLQDAQREVVSLMVTLFPWFVPHYELSMPSVSSKCPVKQMDGGSGSQTHLQVCECVQRLTQVLYSLQAVVIMQDSLFEVQKLLLLEDEAPPTWSLTECVNVKVVEERERELVEEMERIERERIELEVELQEFEELVQSLKDEQMKVEREKKRVEEERESLEKKLNLEQQNNNNREKSLSFIITQDQ